jgi:hypothetical protein
VTRSSSPCCYGRWHRDLTLSFLAYPVGRRRNMGDVTGVSSAPMRERHQRLGSGELENSPRPRTSIGASGETDNSLLKVVDRVGLERDG